MIASVNRVDMRCGFVLIFCILSCFAANAQTKFVESWIYSDVTLSRGMQMQFVKSMVDTGCSFCVIDSAFASEVFQIKENDYITAGYIKKRNFIVLDSLEFCGTTYREVYCIVMDLSGKFMDYALRFIVGGNILIRGAWKFDLANNSVEPCDIKPTASGDAIHWKFFPRKKSVNTIRLKGVIGKQKVDFLFDTGSRYSKLPMDFKAGPTETVRKESANEDSSLQMVEAELTRNVGFKIGKHEFTHDFFDGQRDCGLLNAYSFGGIAVILNYERRTLEVVYE